MKHSKMMKGLMACSIRKYGDEKGKRMASAMEKRFEELCAAYAGDCPAKKHHTERNIFPGIALYETLLKEGLEKPEALQTVDDFMQEIYEPTAELIRKMLKIPGLYKLIPGIFLKMANKMFGPDAGFASTVYDKGKGCARFDMTHCFYFDECAMLGCPELAPVYCHIDECCYTHMHPNLLWNRTETIGRGGTRCDFELKIKGK